MSEATCGGAQRNHTFVAGGEFSERQKSLKSKGLSRRQVPLQSRESPVRIGPGTPCLTKAPNLSRIFSFMKAPHFREVAPGDRGPASQDGAAAAPSLINSIALRSQTPLPLMSEATCGGAQRNHTSVAGGDFAEHHKPLKSKDFSRRQIPLQSRESPVRIDPGDSLLFEGSESLEDFQLYGGPSFSRSRPRRQRSCFAGRRCGCAFAHLRLMPTIIDVVAVNERSDVWWSAAEPHLCGRG